MRICPSNRPGRAVLRAIFLFLAIWLGASQSVAQSQPPSDHKSDPTPNSQSAPAVTTAGASENSLSEVVNAPKPADPQLRLERMPVAGGAELLTIFGRLDGVRGEQKAGPEVPLLSVLRDTLGDNNPENDRLRYVWMLTYARPTLTKRIASAIPFLYQSVGSRTKASQGAPAPILDLTKARRETWNKFFWYGLQSAFFDTYGLALKASSRTYRQNISDDRTAHMSQALSILNTYQNLKRRSRYESDFLARAQTELSPPQLIATSAREAHAVAPANLQPSFTVGEMLELRARLVLSKKMLGGLYGPDVFHETVEKHSTKSLDHSGHNWDLLRQQAESDGLYFEPLTMPDGVATHAILWVAADELTQQPNRRFGGRFLNIRNPWKDRRLLQWAGYSEMRYFDNQNRRVAEPGADGHQRKMIPLAVYGLNHPKIPALLIDFRDSLNPKKREMSRRVMNDVAKNVLSLSSFGNLPYFAGRKAYGFLTGRRGMDVNQPSRVRSYSELKLLLAFNSSIDPKLRSEIEHRLENVTLNPLSNDSDSEIELARQQYDALVRFARREDGLGAKIERDRREEMVPLVHGRVTRFFYSLGNVLTFGRYVHREAATPELTEQMEIARRIEYHTRRLQQVAKSSPQVEVVWNMDEVNASLRFLAERGKPAKGSAARAAALIFERTGEAETRTLCLDVLSRINDKTARKEMLRIFREQRPQSEWRVAVAERLRKAVAEDAHIKPGDAKLVLTEVGQP